MVRPSTPGGPQVPTKRQGGGAFALAAHHLIRGPLFDSADAKEEAESTTTTLLPHRRSSTGRVRDGSPAEGGAAHVRTTENKVVGATVANEEAAGNEMSPKRSVLRPMKTNLATDGASLLLHLLLLLQLCRRWARDFHDRQQRGVCHYRRGSALPPPTPPTFVPPPPCPAVAPPPPSLHTLPPSPLSLPSPPEGMRG